MTNHPTPSPMTAQAGEHDEWLVPNLVMLIHRLVYRLRKHEKPDHKSTAAALDFIQRKNIGGSIFRGEHGIPNPAPAAFDEADAEVERILLMSDQDLDAEIRAQGHDPEELAEEARQSAEFVLAEFRAFRKWESDRAPEDVTPFASFVARARQSAAQIAALTERVRALEMIASPTPDKADILAGDCHYEMEIKSGQVWQEVDPLYTQPNKIVVGFAKDGRVLLRTGARVTKANPKRFNGKRGGYKLIHEVASNTTAPRDRNNG